MGWRSLAVALYALLLSLIPVSAVAGAELDKIVFMTGSGTFGVDYAHVSVGQYLGFYEEEGVELQVEVVDTNGNVIRGLAAGHTDVGSTLQGPVLLSYAQGNDLGLVAIYTYAPKHIWMLGVTPDSPIRSITDLKGKTLGVPSLAAGVIPYLKAIFKDSGIDPESVTFIATGFGASFAEAMLRGQVDAGAGWDNLYYPLESVGYTFRYLELPGRFNDVNGPMMTVRREDFDQNKELYARFLRGVAKSAIFAINNPEAAVRIHWHLYPDSRPRGVSDEEALRRSLHILRARLDRVNIEGKPVQKWGYMYHDEWLKVLEIFDVTEAIPDPSIFYTNELIDAVNDFDQEAVAKMAQQYEFQ